MILRKPYAILIKYFHIIHIIMFVCFSYLVFSLRAIYLFFSSFLNNNYMYFENIAEKYISPGLFIIVIILLFLSISIFALMRRKEKPVLFYKLVIIYSITLFISLIYFYFFFKSLSNTNYEPLRIVINRDIILVLYIVNYLYVAFSFIRGFGFDIKKFSFEKDRKELKLDATDNEEYEVKLNLDKDDVINYVNRQRREFNYYFKENAFVFKIIGIVVAISLTLYFLYSHFVTNRIYKEKESISIGKITYNVNSSLITKMDKYGKIVNDNNYFLIVFLTILNNGNKITLNDQQFRVNVNGNYYYHISNYCDYFNDLGNCYHDSDISSGSKDYILVFKLDNNYQMAYFEILKSKNSYEYNKVKLEISSNKQEIENYNRLDSFSIDNMELMVISYQLLDKTSYTYQECVSGKCNNYTKIVKPKLGDRVLVLKINNVEKLSDDFINNSFGLKYRNKILYGRDIDILDYYNDTLYIGIPSLVHQEDKLVLTINTRKKEYNILLKEGLDE